MTRTFASFAIKTMADDQLDTPLIKTQCVGCDVQIAWRGGDDEQLCEACKAIESDEVDMGHSDCQYCRTARYRISRGTNG
jgi:hypothetical protein